MLSDIRFKSLLHVSPTSKKFFNFRDFATYSSSSKFCRSDIRAESELTHGRVDKTDCCSKLGTSSYIRAWCTRICMHCTYKHARRMQKVEGQSSRMVRNDNGNKRNDFSKQRRITTGLWRLRSLAQNRLFLPFSLFTIARLQDRSVPLFPC